MNSSKKTKGRQRGRRIVAPSVADDVRREIQFHLEMRRDELIAAGWSSADATAEAERCFGDRPRIERSCRTLERRSRQKTERADMFDTLRQDLKFSFRQLLARPTFTLAALITLTLGIGAVSTMYTLIQGVLLYDLPYAEPDRIVNLWERSARGNDIRVGYPNFEDWRDRSTSFENIAYYNGWAGEEAIQTDRGAINVRSTEVSGAFFQVFGVEPILGRTFGGDELEVGAPTVAVVSERFWRTELGAVADLEQASLRMAGENVPIVGVMPESFAHPPGIDLWGNADRNGKSTARTAHNWSVVARLAEGRTIDAARAEMNTIAADIKAQHGDDVDSAEVSMRTIKSQIVGSTRSALLFLFGASALVLLLAATNLASGLVARSIERESEMTLRGALGAGQGRLLRQMLTESVVLTTLGGALGTLFAYGALLLLRRIDVQIPRLEDVRLDATVLLVTLTIAALTGLVFGLIPALRASRIDLRSSMSAVRAGDVTRQRVWNVMVASEVALALVLLVGSLMLVSELWSLLGRSTGFTTEHVAVMDIVVPDVQLPADMNLAAFAEAEQQIEAFHRRFLEELRSQPAVLEVAISHSVPLRGNNINGQICLVPRDCSDDESLQAYPGYRLVSEDYFSLLDIPVLEGRAFRAGDTAESEFVAVINRALAERHFPNGDAIGQQILSGGMDIHGDKPTRIIGVVGNVLHVGLDDQVRTEIFYPVQQRALRTRYASVLVQTEPGKTAGLVRDLQNFLRSRYPAIPPEVVTLDSIRVESVGDRRFALMVLSSLALVALGLALTGIWAVVNYRVAQRRKELGVRMALGLKPAGVLRLVLGDTARLLSAGAVVGGVLAYIGVRVLRNQVGGLDGEWLPQMLVGVVILLVAGLAASWLPARGATKIQPLETLRSEG